MKKFKIYLTIIFISIFSAGFAQNIAINTSGIPAGAEAILDLSNNTNLGFLLPNVSLTSITDVTTITSAPDGLTVYNTNTGLPFGKGVYYWSADSTKWFYLSNNGTSGVVTSVGLSMPSIFNVTGSPVTSSGTLNATLNNQSANLIFAGPASGGPGTPTFRQMVLTDLPTGIPNSNLANSSFTFNQGNGVTINGSPVSLGGTLTITGSGSSITSVGPSVEGGTNTGSSGLNFSSNPITSGAGTISLAASGVTANTYGSATLVPIMTVNAEGQLTSASTASPNNGTITSVGPGTPGTPTGSSGLTFNASPINSTNPVGTLAIANGGVTNAMLLNPSINLVAGTGLSGGGSTVLGSSSALSLSIPVSNTNGGTATSTTPNVNGVVYYSNTLSSYNTTTAGTTGTVLAGNGASDPTFQTLASILGNSYINNQSTVQSSSNFNIQSASPTTIGGVVEGASGQTADLMDFDNSTPTVLTNVDASGNITAPALTSYGTVNLNTSGSATTTIGYGATGGTIAIGNTTGLVGIGTTSPVSLLNANGSVSLGQPSGTSGSVTGVASFYNSTNSGDVSIQAGSFTSSNSYTLTLPPTQGTSNSLLTNDGTGILTWSSASSLLTANNGTTISSGDLQLGGALVQNTTVNASAGNYSMAFDLGTGSTAGTGTFGVNNGGASNPYLYVSPSSNSGSVGIGNNSPGNNVLNVSTTSATSGSGNGVLMKGQTGASSNAGGAVNINGGAGGSNAVGGSVNIIAGAANGNASGSNVIITPGALSGSGTSNGGVAINNTGAAPAAGAILDMESSTSGLLIPRMSTSQIAAIPTGSLTPGLMLLNTTTSCYEFWSGALWQSITCACTGVPVTPPAINGLSSLCAGQTGTYSVVAESGATSYTWTATSGSGTFTGQGTNSINYTYTLSSSGSVTFSVTASNSCGTSGTTTFTLNITNTAPANPGTISGTSTPSCGLSYGYTIGTVSGASYYLWSVPSGVTLNSGQGTNSINVTYVSANTGNITCTPYTSYPGGCPSVTPATLPFTITLAQPVVGGTTVGLISTAYTYTVAPITGATNYTWAVTTSPSGQATLGTQGSIANTITFGSTACSATITCTASNNCVSSPTSSQYIAITACGHGNAAFTTPGLNTWSVPCGITQVTVYVTGAGGGVSAWYTTTYGANLYSNLSYPGYVTAVINVTGMSSLNAYVGAAGGTGVASSTTTGSAGAGGTNGSSFGAGGAGSGAIGNNYVAFGGGGGAASEIIFGSSTILVVGGGSGGGGVYQDDYSNAGGNGYSSTTTGGINNGTAGVGAFGSTEIGNPGTNSGGGAGGTYIYTNSCTPHTTGTAGGGATNGTGGAAGASEYTGCYGYFGGGGGGGGYTGGGGGSCEAAGGGGSSYVNPTYVKGTPSYAGAFQSSANGSIYIFY